MPYPRFKGRSHPRFKDLDGQTFGNLTVLDELAKLIASRF